MKDPVHDTGRHSISEHAQDKRAHPKTAEVSGVADNMSQTKLQGENIPKIGGFDTARENDGSKFLDHEEI